MEQVAASCVRAAPRQVGGEAHYWKSPYSAAMKARLADSLQPVVSGMTTETVRAKLGDAGGGSLRRDLGDIKSGKP